MIPAIHRKLLRDLWRMKGQALAIAFVIAAGVAMFVSQIATIDSLRFSQLEYYERYRFADVFANCKRAPQSLRERIAEIPGVDRVQTRVTLYVMLDLPDLVEPATARIVSYPDFGEPELNNLHFRTGRPPAADARGEVVINQPFADANDLRIGDTIPAIINGRRQTLTVTGTVLSPEYVYALPAGGLYPDDRRFGVFWMSERELAAAYDMDGAFNDVALSLLPGASAPEVMRRLDELLAPYGGFGAIPRAEQPSNWFVENEIEQLEGMAATLPLVFLGVAAFLLNIVMTRLISTQREQVAALKAFGYGNGAIARHYLLLVALVALVGAALGTAFAWWIGDALIELYTEYFHFHELTFHLNPVLVLIAAAITAGAAMLGALSAVRRAVKLPPAEAMRPEAPPTYRATLFERLGLAELLSQPARMIVRELERRPLKAAMSITGIAMSAALVVVGYGMIETMLRILDTSIEVVRREDVTVAFAEPRPRAALHELKSIEGVQYAEPYRSVPARLRFEHRSRIASLEGLPRGSTLSRVLDEELRPIRLPSEGVVLSRVLGDVLGIGVGDRLTVEVLEGARPVREVPVVALVDDFMGMTAYFELETLNRLMREDGVISGAHLLVEDARAPAIYRELQERPLVASISVREITVQNLRETMADNLMIVIVFIVIFACVIAFGVIYNAARITLSERARELASLRVLGMTRAEISLTLLGELAVLTLLAIPLGCVIGHYMAWASVQALSTEVFRLPFYISSFSYSFAAAVVLGAALVSALVVRERLDKLDLVEVLKTRE
jgi:putative ABC transport system permease protein